MQTAENIKKVALIFFVILGLGHIVSGLMTANNYWLPHSLMVNQILEIPFAMTAVIYGFSGLRAGMEGEHKNVNTIFFIVTLLIFGGLIYIQVFMPPREPISFASGEQNSLNTSHD